MKYKLIITFISCLLTYCVTAQDYNKTDANGKQGFWTKSNKKGKVYEGYFFNDRPTGKWLRYHTDGKSPLIEMEYIGQTDSCNATLFNEQGLSIAKGKFYKEKKVGIWKFYNTSGKVIGESNFVDGLEEGESKIFDGNGLCIELSNWKKGRKEGLTTRYNALGKKEFEEEYKDHNIDGPYKIFYENGKVKTKGGYIKGHRDGTWLNYSRLGIVTDSVVYINGIREDEDKAVAKESKKLDMLRGQKGRYKEIDEDSPFY